MNTCVAPSPNTRVAAVRAEGMSAAATSSPLPGVADRLIETYLVVMQRADIGGTARTSEFSDAIIANMNQMEAHA